MVAPVPFVPPGPLLTWWRPNGLRVLFLARALAAAVFVVSALPFGYMGEAGIAVAACGLLTLPLRAPDPVGVHAGLDGAEHLLTSTTLVLGSSYLLSTHEAIEIALAFVAVQALLEYAGAGWSKLIHRASWADGTNLRRVLASTNYGHPAAIRWSVRHPGATRLASRMVIALEIAAPLTLVMPTPLALAALLALLTFHVAAAVIMGLNTFVWAYAATYPAILYLNQVLPP
jgi:hypothetical protein